MELLGSWIANVGVGNTSLHVDGISNLPPYLSTPPTPLKFTLLLLYASTTPNTIVLLLLLLPVILLPLLPLLPLLARPSDEKLYPCLEILEEGLGELKVCMCVCARARLCTCVYTRRIRSGKFYCRKYSTHTLSFSHLPLSPLPHLHAHPSPLIPPWRYGM